MGRGGIALGIKTGLVSYFKADDYDEPQCIPVPLIQVQINTRVTNFIARVEVIQTYANKEKNPIEATYIFPVEEEAAVVEFFAKLDGREVKTVVKEKEVAAQEYREAIQNKQTAFLLEENKPDIFQVKVGHLAAGSSCEVKIVYLTELPVEEEKARLTIPTTIAPKYVPLEDDSPVAKKIASIEYDFATPAPMSMQIDTMMKTKIKEISSPSHTIFNSIEKNKDDFGYFRSTTTFKTSTAEMDRDIVLLIDTEQPNLPRLDLEKGDDGSVVAMLSLVPHFELKDHKAEIIFLIDCSGSMRGQSINLAKEALQLLLSSLPEDCHFNIFKFGSRYEALFSKSKKYEDSTLDEAKKYAINMDADLGGTEILSPLESIFQQEFLPGCPKQVFVLTDGAVSNSESCINCVKRNSSKTRVFTMGIGSGADRNLVKGMARAGRGSFVFATYGEKIAPKVLKQLKHSLQPCISNVKVDWDENASKKIEDESEKEAKPQVMSLIGFGKPPKPEEVKLMKETQAPIIIPPIYDGSRLLLYKMFQTGKQPKTVKITAETPSGTLELSIPFAEDEVLGGKDFHCMFARKLIQDLEEGNYDTATQEETKDLIVELGTTYQLASKHTSFIGVDNSKEKDDNTENGVMNTRQIKNQINQGYGGYDTYRESASVNMVSSNHYNAGVAKSFSAVRSRHRGGSTNEKCTLGGSDSSPERERGAVRSAPRRQAKSKKKFSFNMPKFGSSKDEMQGMIENSVKESKTKKKFSFRMPKFGSSTKDQMQGISRPSSEQNEKAAISSPDDSDEERVTKSKSAPRSAPRSAPSEQPSVPVEAPSDTQKLLKLTSLQVVNGSFKKGEAVVEISGKSMAEIDDEATKENVDKDVWFAALVVALIESMFADDQDSWEMIVEKARKWIKKSGVDEEDLIKKAKIFVQ